ncbi:DUF86 domain-containing protein [Candidatus Poriferisodalis sp.]|uniref:HepT-like ribonuclease domain-containing protein n=1 Tax=Candidatus Poriferisodalis sp. TaxID=3101277 RepID=UPI003B516635
MNDEDVSRLRHLLDAAERAIRYSGLRVEIPDDTMAEDALLRCLTVIGECASRLTDEAATVLPTLPVAMARGLRNRIVHAYWTIDAATAWRTAEDDLPLLAAEVRAALERAQ